MSLSQGGTVALNINIQPYNKLYDPSNNNVYVCIAKCLNGLKLHIENKPVNSLIWYTIVLISRHLLITLCNEFTC